ncbi:MAG: 4Fe-4S ferredoxin [Candidatus Raymondbacteria bacterium RifOxyA12_full_50_37]|uniref:4Fe-4S ferredoxin n=1 Tax=Candidatus Raymondbacteria bacterium RIFOXYD12_FULL_49_13 TaxID=1817890 RepID=A0A1F7F154_UNCRA|nr:MAG: 4Fe-4S ferredoxin [Candidatus Raymondbacteria bacterium RifOxyB12_full_50_8]OGJ90658.1 MAG: 4Fe-4S ferredoxin [Candidatus Raymondbacteria bacterium RifOxyA12_full_50_37]OGJ92001.1 MAG: 4Fe-4S ferredoxin [Candidatus Raymondbacteria bacterium RIFOXYA2_FULL_49_16]OGK00394.1 MAG: 4Fe-4S ferredoxin [Candidatus Raymondbacteria bacterium RIFOXYD12_FULL_49_13]OGP45244.1 MAG: 4Fe-4S ferredoxin [Candidatus Raymondbacteria bacterium RIFOXYB2_FULL_49_35]
MKRSIITIDQDKCTGCGLCIPNCPEGAIQMIDGKARLISDLFCDGLGACLGHCPEGAITTEVREAEPYDERKVMENIVKQGDNTIKAHLEHLKSHGQTEFYNIAIAVLKGKNIPIPGEKKEKPMAHAHEHATGGCPGSRAMDLSRDEHAPAAGDEEGKRPSQLSHWPVQLHLIAPMSPHFKGRDVVLSADCVAYAMGDFHKDFLKGKALAIACPKLDEGQEVYSEKITALIDEAQINTLTVMIMEVPCCRGLLGLAQEAASKAKRKIPIKAVVVGIKGDIKSEAWV